MIAMAWGDSSSSVRLRCTRVPRSTWAMTSIPKFALDVDEESEIDPVAGREGQLLEDLAAPRVLACERLHDRRKVWKEQRHERASDELGDPASLTVAAVERAVVVALDEPDVAARQERADEPEHEARAEVADVGVAPHDDVALRREHRSPERVTLAAQVVERGEDLLGAHDAGTGIGRTLRRAVDRAVVDDEDLVDQARALHQLALDEIDDRADGVLLIAGRKTERDRRVVLRCDEARQVEIAEVEGAHHGGWHGAMVPCQPCFPQGGSRGMSHPSVGSHPYALQPAPSAPLLRSRPRSTAHSADARPPPSTSRVA